MTFRRSKSRPEQAIYPYPLFLHRCLEGAIEIRTAEDIEQRPGAQFTANASQNRRAIAALRSAWMARGAASTTPLSQAGSRSRGDRGSVRQTLRNRVTEKRLRIVFVSTEATRKETVPPASVVRRAGRKRARFATAKPPIENTCQSRELLQMNSSRLFLGTGCLALTLLACSANEPSSEKTKSVRQADVAACTAPYSFPTPSCFEMGCNGFGECEGYLPRDNGVEFMCCPSGTNPATDADGTWFCSGDPVECPP